LANDRQQRFAEALSEMQRPVLPFVTPAGLAHMGADWRPVIRSS